MSDNLTVVPSSTLFMKQFLVAQLTLLSNLCTIANQTINASLAVLYRKSLITMQMMNTKELEDTINVTIDQFFADTIVSFRNTFDFSQAIIQQNEFMSSFLSNWYFRFDFASGSTYNMFPISYGNCSCGKMSNCTQPMTINDISFPGLLIGCLPLSALLQSTLECFHNQTCMDTLHNLIFQSNIMIVSSAIVSLESRFSSNTTVRTIIDELFVERWSYYSKFDAYYRSCLPSVCTYIQIRRFDFFYAITTIISLIGGLASVFRRIIPLLVSGYYFLMNLVRRRQSIRSFSIPDPSHEIIPAIVCIVFFLCYFLIVGDLHRVVLIQKGRELIMNWIVLIGNKYLVEKE